LKAQGSQRRISHEEQGADREKCDAKITQLCKFNPAAALGSVHTGRFQPHSLLSAGLSPAEGIALGSLWLLV